MRIKSISKYFFGAITVAALVGSASVMQAQSTATAQTGVAATTAAPTRTAAQRKIAKAKLRHRARKHARNMTPAQKSWAKSARVENKALRSSVKAGTISKDAAAAQRKEWRKANPRPKKATVGN
jgi:hypothetical protein